MLPVALLTLAVLAAASPGLAQPAARDQVGLAVVEVHPYPDRPPDEGGDPLGIPTANTTDGPSDWMHATYGADWFPTFVVDGVRTLANDPGGTLDDPYGSVRGMAAERARLGAPAVLQVDAGVRDDVVRANVTVVPRADVASDRVVLRTVLVEDPVRYDGGNGVRDHRFTERHRFAPQAVPMEPGAVTNVTRTLDLRDVPRAEGWDRDDLVLVATLRNVDDRAGLEAREVLQATAHRLVSPTSTVQVDKAPLVELYTATWCDPCAPAETAVERLARERGLLAPASTGYLVTTDPVRLGVGLLLAGLMVAALVPREVPRP